MRKDLLLIMFSLLVLCSAFNEVHAQDSDKQIKIEVTCNENRDLRIDINGGLPEYKIYLYDRPVHKPDKKLLKQKTTGKQFVSFKNMPDGIYAIVIVDNDDCAVLENIAIVNGKVTTKE